MKLFTMKIIDLIVEFYPLNIQSYLCSSQQYYQTKINRNLSYYGHSINILSFILNKIKYFFFFFSYKEIHDNVNC